MDVLMMNCVCEFWEKISIYYISRNKLYQPIGITINEMSLFCAISNMLFHHFRDLKIALQFVKAFNRSVIWTI